MNDYSASSIVALKGLEGVQKRPGMYVGDVSSNAATHHLLYEIFDNGVDEALAGHASRVEVRIHTDGSAEITDDGRGIPVDMHPTEGVPAAELVFSSLHAGGKFNSDNYKFSGGLHGVGAAVTNALSEWLDVEIKRNGGVYHLRFEKGALAQTLTKTRDMKKGERNGTRVRFLPSPTYLKDPVFDGEVLRRRFREIAFLNAGLTVAFSDDRSGLSETHSYDGGLVAFVESIAAGAAFVGKPARFAGADAGVEIDMAFAWRAEDEPEDCRAFTNNIPQADGGQHVTGFRAALAKVLLAHGERTGVIKKTTRMTAEDLREGLVVVLHARVPDPAFSSQTKEKLISVEARVAVEAVLGSELPRWLDTHPEDARAILSRAVAAAEAREAAKKAREQVRKPTVGKKLSTAQLPEKLADCSSKDPMARELYLVEGDSAGGSAKQGRDRETQAILPLRGKILNVDRAKAGKMAASGEIDGMVQTMGAGMGKAFDLTRMRYGRVVIMTDADVDGSHIATLLLTFFYRQMRPMIEDGRLFLAAPPLYRIKRKGEDPLFVRVDADLERHFIDRALGQGALTINGAPLRGTGTLDRFAPLLETSDLLGAVAIQIGRSDLADAVLGCADLEPLWARKPLGKTAGAKAVKSLAAALLALDEDGRWTFEADENGINTQRVEDGIVQEWRIDSDLVCNWRVARVRAATHSLGFFGESFQVGNTQTYGPLGLMAGLRAVGSKGAQVSRYKGLGEMNPTELWETTLNPQVRSLYRVDLVDAESAESIFGDLMGDNVGARRALIQKMCAGTSRIDV
jgi:DNA gyrase subunit B